MQSRSHIDVLSAIARQCIGVTCLERFCKRYGISHPALSMFIEHVWKVTDVGPKSFLAWEGTFSSLPITGLGDPWPEGAYAAVPESVRKTLVKLVDEVLEISASTWYSNDLPTTRRCLESVLDICQEHGVPTPDLQSYVQPQAKLHGGWGPPLTEQEVVHWRALA